MCGVLFICRKLIWLSDVDMAKGYAVDFLSISLHAVSRDPEAYSSPCIYTQVFSLLLSELKKKKTSLMIFKCL